MSAVHPLPRGASREGEYASVEELLGEVAETMAYRFATASASRRVSDAIEPLRRLGYRILPGLRWPGRARGAIDVVVVGTSGVFLVSSSRWRDAELGDSGLRRNGNDLSDEIAVLADLGNSIESMLADYGLAPVEVHALGVVGATAGATARIYTVELVSDAGAVEYILARGARIDDEMVEHASRAIAEAYAPRDAEAGSAASDEVTTPTSPDAGLDVGALYDALLTMMGDEPLDPWTSVLSPEQARLVRRGFNGPSRISGAAGTGKTLVGLHRAAYLARTRPGKVLFTSYLRTLPAVLRSHMSRLAPEVAERVEFAGVHSFALRILRSRDIPVNPNKREADLAFAAAWKRIGRDGPLGQIEPTAAYWREELQNVIKGRGLVRFEDYATLPRLGRRRALSREQRAEVWKLYIEYDGELRERDVNDFADLILVAEASLRDEPLEGYDSVIVDEAQDMTLSMIRMLHAVVGDTPDGLNLIGDGQQTIYPGGYTLGEAAVSVRGRAAVMRTNYRNTAEILRLASGIVAGDEYIDIDDAHAEGGEPESLRHGAEPLVEEFSTRQEHDAALLDRIRSMVADGLADYGDIAVLTISTGMAEDIVAVLADAGVPLVELAAFDGGEVNAVKVGTIKRSKGLEFPHVFVARAPRHLVESIELAADSPALERRELAKRELYVAMTRAREDLWVGVC